MGGSDKNQSVENPLEHSGNILVLTLNILHQSVFHHWLKDAWVLLKYTHAWLQHSCEHRSWKEQQWMSHLGVMFLSESAVAILTLDRIYRELFPNKDKDQIFVSCQTNIT